ncbi:unnamed protein product [Leptidea sinapis]|uniref:Uncharacterized protein n=1 Tax=Leptidea sinapis TaxID=189913 RepID=A0A5E4Q819_9NEOP|nr:unnamed protein product [Leptidea sinapis]
MCTPIATPEHRNTMQVPGGNGTQNSQDNNEWTIVQRRKTKYRFSGSRGKAALEANNKFRAADIKVPLFITNVDKVTTSSDITEYIMSKIHTKVFILFSMT